MNYRDMYLCLFLIIFIGLYIIGFINEFSFTRYNYTTEKKRLDEMQERKIKGMHVLNNIEGRTRYAPEVAEGNIDGIIDEFNKKRESLKRKYIHDQINNTIAVVKNIFSAFRIK